MDDALHAEGLRAKYNSEMADLGIKRNSRHANARERWAMDI
jgi:hypothetical protein